MRMSEDVSVRAGILFPAVTPKKRSYAILLIKQKNVVFLLSMASFHSQPGLFDEILHWPSILWTLSKPNPLVLQKHGADNPYNRKHHDAWHISQYFSHYRRLES